LLDGDHYFYEKLRDSLERYTPTPGEVASSLDSALRLILTATRVAPRQDAVRPALGPTLSTGASRAHFRFRHAPGQMARWPGDTLSDFATTVEGFADTLRCLAYAGRTTSSFPGAFEPARPTVVSADADGAPLPSIGRGELRIDMTGVCSEAGAPEPGLQGRVELIDGGVLDNIPLAWAVRAIASSPATQPVDRWLLYLQPVPPRSNDGDNGGGTAARGRPLTRLIGILMKTLSIKAGSESLLDDEAELRSAAARGARARAADGSVVALCRDRPPEAIVNAPMIEQYVHCANVLDAVRFAYLLEHPVDALGGDPLPLPAATNVLAALDELDRSNQFLDACRDVAMAFAAVPTSPRDIVQLGRSPVAVVRACMSLLGWVCMLESDDGGTGVAPEVRDELYSTRLVAETLVAVRERMLLSTCTARLRAEEIAAKPPFPEPAAIATDVDRELTRHIVRLAIPAPDAAAADWRDFAHQLASLVVHQGAHSDPLSNDVGTTPGHGVAATSPANPAVAALWHRLASLSSRLAEHPAGVEATGLENVLPLDTTDALGRLAAYEILVGPLRPDPLAESTRIRVAAITASNASPIENLIFAGEALDDADRVERKLSGNQVANFAAFLSSRWRAADWIWGRLDAAQSIASIIAGRLPPETTTRSDIQRLCFAGASDVVLPTLGHALAALRIDDDNAYQLAAAALTARLHLDILEEELPLLAQLQARNDGSDLPPDAELLDPSPFTSSSDLEQAAPALASVGAETVWTLAGRTDLRRTIVRAGLVAWEALQPTGGFAAALLRIALLLLKPFAVAALIAYIAPASGIIAAAAAYLVAAIIAGDWFSWLAYVFAAGGALLVVAGSAQRWLGRDVRSSSRRTLWWTMVVLAAIALGVLGYILNTRTGSVEWSTGRAVASVAVLELFGAGLPLRWLTGRRRSARFLSRALRIATAVLAATAAGAIVCWIVYPNDVPRWFAALLGVWAPLVAVTAVLMLAYPPSNDPTTERVRTGQS
jgi:patatin-related protein